MAPNIYYLGYSGVVKVGDLRVAGISGIYDQRDFYKGTFSFSFVYYLFYLLLLIKTNTNTTQDIMSEFHTTARQCGVYITQGNARFGR